MRNIETYCGLSFGYKIITTKQQQLSVQIVTQTYSYKSISKSRKMLPPPRLNAMKWLTLLAAIAAFCTPLAYAATQPDADQKGPVFLNEPTNRIDFSNSTGAEIECKASGNPMPEIIWIRSDGTAVGDVPGLRQISSDGKLVFPPFRAEDYRQEVHAQVYACLARNQFGTIISRDVHVRAVVAQYYEADVNKEHVIRGNAAVIKCLIPSFVADFVEVVSWHTDSDENYFPGTEYGAKFTKANKFV